MLKIIAPLVVVVALAGTGVYKFWKMQPVPQGNTVIAEKSEKAIGGQVAVLVPNDMKESQYTLLNAAYSIAKEDGHKSPELLQGIILQESKAGSDSKYRVSSNGKFFGVGQITMEAAKAMMSRYPDMWRKYQFQTHTDDELKAQLIMNNHFNMAIASKYLWYLHTTFGYEGLKLANAYQAGPGGVQSVGEDHFYGQGVQQKIASLGKRGNH